MVPVADSPKSRSQLLDELRLLRAQLLDRERPDPEDPEASAASLTRAEPTASEGAAILDIPDRAGIEEKLRVSEARLAEAQRVAHIGSWEWNMLTGEVWWSDEMYRIARRDPAVFQPSFEAFLEMIHPDDREFVNRAAEEALQKGRSVDVEPRILRGEERPGIIHTVSHVEFDEFGEPIRLVGTAQDITDRKQAEEERRLLDDRFAQARKLESLGLMASGIAHDFNNLLVGIMGNASLASSGLPPDSPARPLVQDIERASARAAGLVSELLAYAGEGAFSVQTTELGALVLDTAQLLRPRVPVNAELVSTPPAESVWVEADATQLGQVVMNLITNAADSLRGKSGKVTVETLAIDVDSEFLRSCVAAEGLAPGRYACVRVRDTGCGMSPELIEKIFDPFYTTKSSGRGLGLAFVLGIVKGHRGALRIESDPEQGSVFSVLLPRAPAQAVPTSVSPETEVRPPQASTVLLIDDDEAVLEVTTLMLERAGLKVLSAGDGRNASAMFRRASADIDLVMLDINMPGMDGTATCEEIRSIRPDIPVLFCSGRSHREGAARIAGQRGAGFLQKPFTFDTLIAKIAEVLRDASPSRPS